MTPQAHHANAHPPTTSNGRYVPAGGSFHHRAASLPKRALLGRRQVTVEPRDTRRERLDGFHHRVVFAGCSLAINPLTAPAIMRLTAASASPASALAGIVAKPIADAFG